MNNSGQLHESSADILAMDYSCQVAIKKVS